MTVTIQLELPADLAGLRLPPALAARLQSLLDQQDVTGELQPTERAEAEAIIEMAEFLTLLRLRSEQPV